MLKGIVIIATGNPYYGRLAYNLAVSVKAVEDFPVAVLWSGRAINHLSESQLNIFDHIIEMGNDVPGSSGAKLWVNQYSPFKETLLLDADMLWMPKKKPSEIFKELEEVEFTAITEGYWTPEGSDTNPKYFYWADPAEIQKVYKTDHKIYQWRTEVMYFKKTQKVNKMFTLARKVFKNPGLSIKTYAGGVADELGVNVATAVNKMDPHVYKWSPAYWHRLNGNIMPDIHSLYEYYLVSFGSNQAGGAVKKFYDRIMKASTYKLGLSHVFPLQSKKEVLPERAKM